MTIVTTGIPSGTAANPDFRVTRQSPNCYKGRVPSLTLHRPGGGDTPATLDGAFVQLNTSTRRAAIAAALLAWGAPLAAQGPKDSITDSTAAAAPAQPPQAPLPFAFSGVLYLNYQYGGATSNRSDNRFDLERAYLNFRAASGSRDSVRVTLDVYQQRDASRDQYYRGWTMRVKYAYLQHDFLRGSADQARVSARLGLIQTVMIEKEEQYWNRGLSQVAVEQGGYFNSADAGAAVAVSLPGRAGELYATIVNGAGYASRETDRFKDFQARLTLTPWARGGGALRGLQLSPWFSAGARASDFASRRGTVQPVTDARTKNRYGFLATYRDARIAAGAHLARKIDVAESADTTRDVSPSTRTVTGNLVSAFAFVRPLATAERSHPWSLLVRADNARPDRSTDGTQRRYIVGSTWDISSRTSLTLDVQSVSPRNGLTGSATRTFFLHLISNF